MKETFFKNFALALLFMTQVIVKAQYPISPYVVPNIDWIQYYSQSSSVVSSPTAIDINSNVYTTGYSGLTTSSNLIALKYDSLGALTYSYSYNNGNYDLGKAIKVDGSGNAYIAGVSYASTTLNDFYIIKLGPTGSVIWSKRLDNAHLDDEPYDIALDASGNAYVTGKSKNSHGDFDVWTVALSNSAGTTLWSNVYNGAAGLNDNGSGIVLSSNSSTVYITGNTNDAHGSNIITFALKAATGATVSGWPVITDGTAHSNDYSNGIIRCGQNIVICGETNNTTTGIDYTTIKYNGLSGSIIWQKQYDFSNATNRGTALARDSSNHVGVVGTALNGSTLEYHTVLYDSLGNQLVVNKESTGLSALLADPKICNDTIAHHWYVAGCVSNASQDILVYQITPTGTTSWKRSIDGQNFDYDVATGIGVNGVGVVYVGAHSKNSSAQYDYTTIKINQTPVYFPPDLANEKPIVGHLFYENKGQIIRSDSVKVAKNILFNSEMYPYSFYGIDRFSYKFFNHAASIGGNDTTQRIDVVMHKANTMATAYPYIPDQGTVSHMEDWLPNMVTGIQGYQRYFIPNIYPSIDLHYYSNQNGLKMYYVLKPQANPASIQWDITGATTTTINGTNLEIKGLNGKVVFDQPTVYTTNTLGIAVTLTTTATWQHIAGDSYSIALSAYSPTMPIIIELDYGNAAASTSTITDNRCLLTYYGGFNNDGIKAMDVDKSSGNFVFLSGLKNDPVASPSTWPVICCGYGLSVSTTTNINTEFFGIVVMDKDGRRLTANTYGIYGYEMRPLKVAINNNYVTVIGNNNTPHPSLPSPAQANLPFAPTSSTSYTSTQGEGYVVQFSGNLFSPVPYYVLNNISWATRLNGNASDLDKTPDGKYLYITTSTDNYNFTPSLLTKTGAYNSSTFVGGGKNFQISKFDTVGGRKWATIYQCPNTIVKDTIFYNTLNNNSTTSLISDQYIKCKISCDKYGFSIAGQTNGSGLKIYSKYGSPLQSTIGGSRDGFYARFNSKDSITFSSYVGSNRDDMMTGIKNVNDNSTAIIGYSNSQNLLKMTTNPNLTEYIDSTSNGYCKIFIAKFDTLGNKTWATFYGTGTSDIYCNGLGVDQNEGIFTTGRDLGAFNNIVSNPSGMYSNFAINNTESYILSFNKYNQPIWNTRIGGHGNDVGLTMAFNKKNNRLLWGGLTNSTSGGALTPAFPIWLTPGSPSGIYLQPWLGYVNPTTQTITTYDGFVGIFDNQNLYVGINEYYKNKDEASIFDLFPNPASDYTSLAFKQELKGLTKIMVYNEMGQLLYERDEKEILKYSLITLNVGNLSKGIYIVNVVNNGKILSKKLIIAG